VHETVRGMINCIVTDLLDTTRQNLNDQQPRDIEAVRASGVELVQFSETLSRQHRALKNFLRSSLYRHDKVLEMSARAKKMVRTLFGSYMQDPHNMPEEHSGKAGQWEAKDGEAGRARAVADYVAGMTDRYAIAAYGQLVGEMAEPG
jgi:dGTPase